jgi:hypothetical protein
MSPPPLCPRLVPLYEEVGQNRQIVDRFVADYLSLLDKRMTAITASLDSDSYDGTFTSVLSLETTSVMIGATEVARAARAIRAAVQQRQDSAIPELVGALVAATTSLRSDLERAGYGAHVS